jgi:predicted regulator of Ras-like GTPase activity (Roadblock/LC7/MglB family)
MSEQVEKLVDELLDAEENVYGVAVIGKDGNLLMQTENWDISNDLGQINELLGTKLELGQKGMSSIRIQGIKYMIVENTEERKIGTNIKGKGHVIICPVPVGGTGAIVCYINPKIGPRDALLEIQKHAQKFDGVI